ncbi:MAG: acetylxylan esterase [Acidobacteriota bacterium]
MRFRCASLLLSVLMPNLFAGPATCQTDPDRIAPPLAPQIQAGDVTSYELRRYIAARIPGLPVARTAEEWAREANRLRQYLLSEVVFRGWPREWVSGPLKVEDLGEMPSGPGYKVRKLRFEIVPGFQTVGILYEPERIQGKIPAILNVNGHYGALGKADEAKQKQCINQARQGIVALNLEWLNCGELFTPENSHWFGAHLDLVGSNAVGLFYLAMRKGLDFLYEHPAVDRERIGVTGVSGGGWQTIVLGALDERVGMAVPVAGYSAFYPKLEGMPTPVPGTLDIGDIEQNASDMFTSIDYPHLTAMRAPRPTLLIYNVEDDCCFRAPLVKPQVFDAVAPVFGLYGKEQNLAWYENIDPGDHNYYLDNRVQSYRFFTRHFGLPEANTEIPVGSEIKSREELTVGLAKENLTILELARKLAERIERKPAPPAGAQRLAWAAREKGRLGKTVRYRAAEVRNAWPVGNTKRKGVETRSYRFELDNGLSVAAVWLKGTAVPEKANATIVLHDKGKKAAQEEVADRVNREEQVLAVELLFIGNMTPSYPESHGYTQLLSTMGERPLGIVAAQLIGVARWLRNTSSPPRIRLHATGIRSQVTAFVAAALEPELFSEVVVREGKPSLRYLLDKPVEYQAAPELFCLDLYKDFDLDRLAELGAPTRFLQ